MREMAEEALTVLKRCPHGMFSLVTVLKIDTKTLKGKGVIEVTESNFRVWKHYIES